MRPLRLPHILLLAGIGLSLVGVLLPLAAGPAGDVHQAAGTELVGTLGVVHGDDFTDGNDIPQHESFFLDTGTTTIAITVPNERHVGERVRVRGSFVTKPDGPHFAAVTVRGLTPLTPVPAPGPGSASGSGFASVVQRSGLRSVAVILFNFANDRGQPWSPEVVQGILFDNPDSVNAYYQSSSDGQVSLAGDVLGWYRLNIPNTGCNYLSWRLAARAAAIAAGVNLTNYQHTVYAFPKVDGCTWGGLGERPGTSSYMNGFLSTSTVAHELGHNFGLDHAGALTCASGSTTVTLSDACSTSDYGDPFSVMGSGSMRLLSNWERAKLGWLDDTETVTTTGTYTLAALNDATATPRTLRISRGDGTYFVLELRAPGTVFDAYQPTWPVVNGVSIRLAPDPSVANAQPKLLDTTPETATFWDAALPLGATFTDQYGHATGTQITTVDVSPTEATVYVKFSGAGTAPRGANPGTLSPDNTPTTTAPAPSTTNPPATLPVTTVPPPPTTAPPAPAGPGSPQFVKTVASATKSQSGNASLMMTVPAGGNAAAGHRLIVTGGISTFAGLVTCSDNRGNSYTVDGRAPTNNLFVCSAHLTTGLEPGDTITLTYPGFSGVSTASASEYTGILATNAVDNSFRSGASTSTKTVSVSPGLTTTSQRTLLFGAVGSSAAFSAGNDFELVGSLNGVSSVSRAVDETGSFSTLGEVQTGAWRALLLAYRAA